MSEACGSLHTACSAREPLHHDGDSPPHRIPAVASVDAHAPVHPAMASRATCSGPDFNRAPVIVIWEATRACDLVCRHCRAEAQPQAAAGELSDREARELMDQVREDFGPVLFVITGGDPMKRANLETLVRHGADLGLTMALTPSVTPLLTIERIAALQAAGIRRLALSLDGADAATHDDFRGVPGTFARTIELLGQARKLGLETQINSSIGQHNRGQLDQLAEFARYLDIHLWSVFLLVPTGRADPSHLLTAAEHERIYRHLAAIALDPATPYQVKTTAGQPFYRVLEQERVRRNLPPARRPGIGVNDGNGFVFVSHTGEICPSGFLPLVRGNLRTHRLAEVYRHDEIFVHLRDPDRFAGKCGICDYRTRCGGSRSRTHALTGDAFASDPTCVYQPKATTVSTRQAASFP